MLIFIKKHFRKESGLSLTFLISIAIYFWGFVTLIKSLLRRFLLPATDMIILYFLFAIIIPLWEKFRFGDEFRYPGIFSKFIIPLYALIIVASVFISGGYKVPSSIINIVKGIVIGTATILVIYALLPLDLRFSRAIIILGGIAALMIIPFYRILLDMAGFRIIHNPFTRAKKTIIVGDEDGFNNIRKLISNGSMKTSIAGRVSIRNDDLGAEVLGNLEQLAEIIRINRIDEVIFSTKELSASQIINSMHLLSERNITVRISPPGEKLIIGTNSVSHLKEV